MNFPEITGRRHPVQIVEVGVPAADLEADPGLADARVGFGLSSILVEALADSGHFDLVESEEAILERHRTLWQRTEDGFYAEDRRPAAPATYEYGVRARISYARSSGRTFSVGPFTTRKDTLRVAVTVCLQPATGGGEICREAEGEAEQKAGGAIYEYRGDRLEFAKTAAGLATRRAARQAVSELVRSIPPST